jgi:hypothetical protein
MLLLSRRKRPTLVLIALLALALLIALLCTVCVPMRVSAAPFDGSLGVASFRPRAGHLSAMSQITRPDFSACTSCAR